MESAGWAHENIPGTGISTGTVTVSALRQALASGELTSAALTGFYLGRIERLNPELRAVIEVSPDAAGAAAASDWDRTAGGGPAGPLAGIPVLIKDNIAVAGQPATVVRTFLTTLSREQFVLPICSAMGFAYVLRHTGCDQHLVRLLVEPVRRAAGEAARALLACWRRW
jgi:hypothetical protein